MTGCVLESLVGQVAHGLGHGAEGGRRLDPTHSARHGDAYQLRLVVVLWQDQGKAEAVQGSKEEAVEAILNVGLGSSNGSVSRVCVSDDGEESVQGPTELHGFGRCMRKGGLVDGRPAP